jgi:folate-binding protein YgfZ
MTISDSPSVHFWRPAAWLRVSGPDAFTFLQGQHTNDLGRLKTSPAVYGLWLNQKGRVQADSFVLRGGGEEEFWIGSYFSPSAVIRERMESHIIADDVTVVDESADWFGATLVGVGLAEEARAAGDGIFFPGRRGLDGQTEWMTRRPLNFADAATLSHSDMERARIRAAIPAIPADIGPGELPNEGGLESAAISYTKGCYLGQEVMARLKSMGQVRRRLLGVAGTGAAPARLAKLFQGERQVGELRSIAAEGDGFIGLALLTLMHLQPDQPLSLAPDAPPAIKLANPS